MMIRLQKYLSECGLLSRRAAEKKIAEGAVTVDGEVAVIGQQIDPETAQVSVDGVPVAAPPKAPIYLMLHKPVGYVTTLSDEKGRPCVAELVADCGRRVYPVGRLDLFSEGLLLLTDDGELTNRLTHPRHEIPKYYEVTLTSRLTDEQLEALRQPMTLEDGYVIRPVSVELLTRSNRKTVVNMTLFEGRNRQIRQMCGQVGAKIYRLRRTALGELELGDLAPGAWRILTPAEVAYLKGEADHV